MGDLDEGKELDPEELDLLEGLESIEHLVDVFPLLERMDAFVKENGEGHFDRFIIDFIFATAFLRGRCSEQMKSKVEETVRSHDSAGCYDDFDDLVKILGALHERVSETKKQAKALEEQCAGAEPLNLVLRHLIWMRRSVSSIVIFLFFGNENDRSYRRVLSEEEDSRAQAMVYQLYKKAKHFLKIVGLMARQAYFSMEMERLKSSAEEGV
jgi:hypothetical protein